MKRIEIRELIRCFGAYDLDGMSMDELSEWAQSQKSEKYSCVYINVESYGHDGGVDFSLMGERMESDAEYEKRVEAHRKDRAEEKRRKEAKKDREYKEFLRLREKFEDA
jgi:hypothetical protein